jgi:hypothetical protein
VHDFSHVGEAARQQFATLLMPRRAMNAAINRNVHVAMP